MFGCTISSFSELLERCNAIVKGPDNLHTTPSTESQLATAEMPARQVSESFADRPSPRNSWNKPGNQAEQRRTFLNHLAQWSLNHDSCAHFHGKISILPQCSSSQESFELGQSVPCILTDTFFTDSRQSIIIRLFPPHVETRNRKATYKGHEPMACRGSTTSLSLSPGHGSNSKKHASANGYYRLVVRCGAGWMSSRDFFNRTYFSHLEARQASSWDTLDLAESLRKRSLLLGPPPSDKESVSIRPLFRNFQRLPAELQDMILLTAAGLSRSYNLCLGIYGEPKAARKQRNSPISLAAMFGISKAMNEHLVPHVYRSTDFEFGLTGFVTTSPLLSIHRTSTNTHCPDSHPSSGNPAQSTVRASAA
jgi:hypothetical protein